MDQLDRTTPQDVAPLEEAMVHVCRSARLTSAAYQFYRAILLAFVELGHAPAPEAVAALARQSNVPHDATLARMAAQDLVQRDPATGRIRAAYPFSGVPTLHQVVLFADHRGQRIDRVETQVYAMCALDALGAPLMLRRAALITSADALTGDPIHVLVRPLADPRDLPIVIPPADWRAIWDPVGSVVYARPPEHEAEHDTGACLADGTCCPITNFFAAPAYAQMWVARQMTQQPAVPPDGLALTQAEALERSHALFAGVLDRLEA